MVTIIALYPFAAGRPIKDHFNEWLEGTLDHYEALDYTWPVPNYQDVLSEKPFEGDRSGWRFGVISLRRGECGKGWWKTMHGNGIFFQR